MRNGDQRNVALIESVIRLDALSTPIYQDAAKYILLHGARDRNCCCREPLSIDTTLSIGKIFKNFKNIRSSVGKCSVKGRLGRDSRWNSSPT